MAEVEPWVVLHRGQTWSPKSDPRIRAAGSHDGCVASERFSRILKGDETSSEGS